jgi:hypothetical protein
MTSIDCATNGYLFDTKIDGGKKRNRRRFYFFNSAKWDRRGGQPAGGARGRRRRFALVPSEWDHSQKGGLIPYSCILERGYFPFGSFPGGLVLGLGYLG